MPKKIQPERSYTVSYKLFIGENENAEAARFLILRSLHLYQGSQ